MVPNLPSKQPTKTFALRGSRTPWIFFGPKSFKFDPNVILPESAIVPGSISSILQLVRNGLSTCRAGSRSLLRAAEGFVMSTRMHSSVRGWSVNKLKCRRPSIYSLTSFLQAVELNPVVLNSPWTYSESPSLSHGPHALCPPSTRQLLHTLNKKHRFTSTFILVALSPVYGLPALLHLSCRHVFKRPIVSVKTRLGS